MPEVGPRALHLRGRGRRALRSGPTIASLLLLLCVQGCAGTLVVRAPQEPLPQPESRLALIAPLSIAVPPPTGTAAAADPLGEWAAGWGRRGGTITSTERPGDLVRRVVVQELAQAGHRVVDRDPDVWLRLNVLGFAAQAPRAGRGWDVIVSIRISLRVEGEAGADEWSEFVLSTESRGHTPAPPGVAFVERILGEAVRRLAQRVAEGEGLADALERFGRRSA